MENDTSKPIVRVEAVLHQVIRIHTQDTHKHTHRHKHTHTQAHTHTHTSVVHTQACLHRSAHVRKQQLMRKA